MTTARLAAACFATALTLAAALGVAQPADPATGQPAAAGATAGDEPVDPKVKAAEWDAEGREHYRSGRFLEAYRAFEAAHRLDPKPNYTYNMARCKEKLAKYDDAVALLERYLDEHKRQTGNEAGNKADVEHLIRQLRQRAYESLPQVLIGSNPPGAVVQTLADGRTLGTTPLTTHLRPGVYKLRLEMADHQPLEADLVVPETGSVRAVFALTRIVRVAALSFWCNIRQTKIAVDGKVVAVTPFSGRVEVQPGRHQVSLSREGYTTIEEIVEVPENHELHLDYIIEPLESRSSWRTWLGWPIAVIGLGGVAGGVAAGVQAEQFYRGSPSFENWAGWQKVGYGAGAAVLASGVALIVWDANRENIPVEDMAPGPKREKGRKLTPMDDSGPQPGATGVKR